MIKSFAKSLIRNNRHHPISLTIPSYNFILGRIFKKEKLEEENNKKIEEQKLQAEIYEREKKNMKREVEKQNIYDFLQRQKDIELNRDFRKQKLKYDNTIPQDIGKAGFNQLVYWSKNAQTPQLIVDMIQKFNKTTPPKNIQDQETFLLFLENVKATVYLAQTYSILVDYSHFAYKYQITEPEFWLKIEQKVIRKPPKSEQQINELIDIVFVMGNIGQGEVIFSSAEKILVNRKFTVQQIAKLIIAFFKTSKGQKQWITQLLVNFELQMNQANGQVLESILPILKQSKNIPLSFDVKLESRITELEKELSLGVICAVSQYFGFEKGAKQTWSLLQKVARTKISQIKKQKGKITSNIMSQIIPGILSSYKFSTEFLTEVILPQLQAKQCKMLSRLSPTILSTLSKCLYIFQLESSTQNIEQTIQSLIMKQMSKISQVTNEDLVHVLKDYTVTRLGSREFYLFLQGIVNDKLQDIKTDTFTIESLTAIYLQSNLCSTDTLELLKGMAYE